MDPFLGEIRLFAFNFTPTGWLPCDGRLLPIQNYTALFALIGTYYGGNGVNNFALPDLRSRVPVGLGQGPGLSAYNPGQMGGEENHQLAANEMPMHNHTLATSSAVGTVLAPGNAYLAGSGPTDQPGFVPDGADSTLAPNAISMAGASAPHNNVQPYLAVNFCIAYQGVFPSRA